IFQPSADEIYFRLWTGVSDERLYLLSRPQQARFHLTERSFPNPFTPPRFCQLLRARLARLLNFEQVSGDRLVIIHCAGRDRAAYKLLVDLRPKPNLVLLDDDDRIVDLLRRGGEGELPGDMYAWPDKSRELLTPENLPIIPYDCSDSEVFNNWLLVEAAPMSKLAAMDMASCVRRGEMPVDVLRRYINDLGSGAWQPKLVSVGGKQLLTVLPLYCQEHSVVAEYESISLALDQTGVEGPVGGVKSELVKTVRKGLARLRKRLQRIESDYADLEDTDGLQHTGNLLLSNLYLVRRGMKELEVDDYAADPPTRTVIQLDPRLTPQENADKLFKKARKRRRGEEHYARRLRETRDEIDWLEAMALAFEETDDAVELDALKKQLAAAGYLKLREEPVRRQTKAVPAQQLEAVSPSGYQLVWGRNPRENDRISRHLAAPDDLWFHAHNLPGCHLVLRRAGRSGDIPEEDILYAASLAAGYSRGRNDSRVEVIVALAKDVRKPKGARPGLVTVDSFRTMAVEPIRL
ncbi:MAG: NFACT family protein, partial [Desulfuromonadales bacterium]|nr:NFACT family protein [Desulfuromonadales bacterium]